jgi:predicted HTH transcriptional regulator
MTNIRDGGSVVIGVEQKKQGTFELSGMTQADFDSFNYETISAVVAEYADPYITFSLTKDELQGKRIVIIDVEEFQDIPVVCKKDGSLLKRGKLYTRGLRVPESVEVPSQTEMREILDIAIEKGIRKFFRSISRAGITLKEPEKKPDIELFEKQLRETQK